MKQLLSLQCPGQSNIDISGLNKQDRDRIKEVGFDSWLDEISGQRSSKNKTLANNYNAAIKTIVVEAHNKSTSKLKPGSTGDVMCFAFLNLAKANKNIVTYEQCAVLCPAYPGDPVAWARQAGATVRTEKKNRRYIVEQYV